MAAIDQAVEARVHAIRRLLDSDPTTAQPASKHRLRLDRQFSALNDLLAPRIAYLIRRYGLTDMAEDARQAGAIAILRAVREFDDEKASFSTFVTWKLRGELQTMRHRVRLDQRPGAIRIGARTVSLEWHGDGAGETAEPLTIIDEGAETRTEAGASAVLARRMTVSLLQDYAERRRASATRRERDCYGAPSSASMPDVLEQALSRELRIVSNHLTGRPGIDEASGDGATSTKEQKRQITRRVLRPRRQTRPVGPTLCGRRNDDALRKAMNSVYYRPIV